MKHAGLYLIVSLIAFVAASPHGSDDGKNDMSWSKNEWKRRHWRSGRWKSKYGSDKGKSSGTNTGSIEDVLATCAPNDTDPACSTLPSIAPEPTPTPAPTSAPASAPTVTDSSVVASDTSPVESEQASSSTEASSSTVEAVPSQTLVPISTTVATEATPVAEPSAEIPIAGGNEGTGTAPVTPGGVVDTVQA